MPARRVIVSPQGLGLAITTSSLPNAVQSNAYSFQLTAAGGTGLVTWALVSQTGTNTWSVSTSGLLTATPGTVELDNLVVACVDSLLNHVSRHLSVQVGIPPVAAIPTFSPVAGTYASTQTVTLTCSTPSSSIYFTTDGSTPTFPITGTTTLYTGAITVSATETIKAIGTAAGFTNSTVGSALYTIGAVTTTVPNILALSAAFPAPNTTAYNALNVPAMAPGTLFSDPVTGVKTWKVTSATTPVAGMWAPWYPQMGLGISQAWGTNLDQYHVTLYNLTNDTCYVCDFGPSWSSNPVGPYNYRVLPSSRLISYAGGTASFSRRAGNPHIMYILASGGKVRLYDVSAGVFVDSNAAALGYSASWPSTGWSWNAGISQWFMVNAAETWAHARLSSNTFVAINLVTGATQSWAAPFLVDDAYIGYGDFATGDGQNVAVWDLDANTQIAQNPPLTGANGWQGGEATSHVAIMRGYWIAQNTEGSGSLPFPAAIISQSNPTTTVIGSTSAVPYCPKAVPQYHTSGNWWLQTPGSGQYFLQSTVGTLQISPNYPASEGHALSFVNVWAGTMYRLGHSYSVNPATNYYYEQPHAHISHDGKLVMFGSNMLQTPTAIAPNAGSKQVDLFVMEVPLQAGTPPSFP